MSEKKGKKMRRLSRAASKRIRGGIPGTTPPPPDGGLDLDPPYGPQKGQGKPSAAWLVAVLNGNASDRAKAAVTANH